MTSLTTPLSSAALLALRAGDHVTLSGTVYAARDTAHRRMIELLDNGLSLPFDLCGAAIYHVGPSPAPPGYVIGSAGPTTAYRMDAYAPRLYALGLAATIGKGKRSPELRNALRQHGGIFFGATGGAAALLSRHIVTNDVIAWPDLGPEAVRKLVFQLFPLIVIYDAHGGSVFGESGGSAPTPPQGA